MFGRRIVESISPEKDLFYAAQPGLRVPELAKILGVSQGTIRNDLNALHKEGQVTRVRGGAALGC
jgi:DeoR/GlpR family transcriptional regulator of sugar metabolism